MAEIKIALKLDEQEIARLREIALVASIVESYRRRHPEWDQARRADADALDRWETDGGA